MLQVYKFYSEMISSAVSSQGQYATTHHNVKAMRCVPAPPSASTSPAATALVRPAPARPRLPVRRLLRSTPTDEHISSSSLSRLWNPAVAVKPTQ